MSKPTVKALFFDIDGTLLGYITHQINPRDLESLERLKEKGYLLFIATGRDLTTINESRAIKQAEPIMTGFISANGQQCWLTDGTEISFHPLSPEDLIPVRTCCEEHHIAMLYSIAGITYVTEMTDHVKGFAKHVGMNVPEVRPLNPDMRDIAKLCVYASPSDQKKYLDPIIRHSWTARNCEHLIDLIPEGIGKDSGIREVCAHFGIDPAQTMAFGDGANDIPMLKAAGIGVAMRIAQDKVKESADYVTGSSEEAGITQALEHFGLL